VKENNGRIASASPSKLVFLCIAVFACFVVLMACSGGNRAGEPFRITINSWIGFAPLYVAQEKGIFDREGVRVELVRIEDTGARKSSMISNRVDAYGASVDGIALDAAQGLPARIVMAFDQSSGADGIIAKKDIKTIAELKGRTIAVQPGLTGHFLLMYVLSRNGLTPKDVKITDMDSDKAGAAFAAGQVDVAVTWEPWLSQAQEKGGHKLVTSAELPGVIVDILGVTEKAWQEKRDQIKRVVRSWYAALGYMNSNPDDATQIIAKAYGLTAQQVRDYLSGVKFLAKEDNKNYLGTRENPGQVYEIYRMASEIWKNHGIIQNSTQAEQHIDPTIILEVQ
jgi:NitT/TauT family transport system substrate-binding protein